MRILITGGTGFIGANLARRLVEAGDEVVILDDFSNSSPESVADIPVTVIRGSISDVRLLAEAALGSAAIVHLAARGSVPRSVADPRQTFEVNAIGTLNVVEVAREQGQHVIFSSSSSVYGANPKLPKTELDWTQPISPYGASKLAAESIVLAHSRTFGFDALALRFFNVFGPGQLPDHQYAAVVPKWMRSITLGEPVEVHGDGKQTRDFTYVGDVVDALSFALRTRLSLGSPVNLAFGDSVSLLGLLEMLEDLYGAKFSVTYSEPRAGDIRDSLNDPLVLRKVFPSLEPTPWPHALRETRAFLEGYLSSQGSG